MFPAHFVSIWMNILNHFTVKETIYSQNYQRKGIAGLKFKVRNFWNRVNAFKQMIHKKEHLQA